MAYPVTVDLFVTPSGTDKRGTTPGGESLAGWAATIVTSVTALENKLGVGNSTAVVNSLLVGTGAGTSTWQSSVSSITLATATINNSTLTTATVNNSAINNSTISTPTVNGWDGWQPVGDTWSYASSTTVTYTGTRLTYDVGDKVRFNQTTDKYFYITGIVTAAGVTTLTLIGGNDFSVANAAISKISYSKEVSPTGFPQWFSFTPTYVAAGGTPPDFTTVNVGKFWVSGKECVVKWYSVNSAFGTPGSGAVQVSLLPPVVADVSQVAANTVIGGNALAFNNATGTLLLSFVSTGGTLIAFKKSDTSNLTAGDLNNATRQLMGQLTYAVGTAPAYSIP